MVVDGLVASSSGIILDHSKTQNVEQLRMLFSGSDQTPAPRPPFNYLAFEGRVVSSPMS
jgi:hypothetical protein